MFDDKTQQASHLTEYYYVLTKHKTLIIASLVIIVSLTLLFTYLMQPVYEATAILVIEKEQSTSPLTGERMDFESYVSQSLTFNTHFKLITSRPVLERVINSLKLNQIDMEKGLGVNFLSQLLTQFKKNIRLLLGSEKKPLTPQEEMSELIEELRENIEIEEVRDTRLLKVTVEDHDPVMAMKIANDLARSYIKFNIDNRLKATQSTLSWLTGELYEMKKKLEDSEEDFVAYQQREKLLSITGKQKLIAQKIEELNTAYHETKSNRLEMDSKLKELERTLKAKGSLLDTRILFENPIFDNLYAQLLNAEVELTRLGKVFKPKHPKIIQIKSKITKTRAKLNEELKKEIGSLKSERRVFFSKEQSLRKAISGYENDALAVNRKALKYTILNRDVQTNQKLYDTLLSRVRESNVVGNKDVSNIRIAEQAEPPLLPVKPKKMLNLVLSVIFGLMTGLGLSFFWEYLDRSLHTEEDIKRYIDVPVLAVIPIADSSGK